MLPRPSCPSRLSHSRHSRPSYFVNLPRWAGPMRSSRLRRAASLLSPGYQSELRGCREILRRGRCPQKPGNGLLLPAEDYRGRRRLYSELDAGDRSGPSAACESRTSASGGRGRALAAWRQCRGGACAIWSRRFARASDRPERARQRGLALCKSCGWKDWPPPSSTRMRRPRARLRQSITRRPSRIGRRASAWGPLVGRAQAALRGVPHRGLRQFQQRAAPSGRRAALPSSSALASCCAPRPGPEPQSYRSLHRHRLRRAPARSRRPSARVCRRKIGNRLWMEAARPAVADILNLRRRYRAERF